jgi:hypothetical protein
MATSAMSKRVFGILFQPPQVHAACRPREHLGYDKNVLDGSRKAVGCLTTAVNRQGHEAKDCPQDHAGTGEAEDDGHEEDDRAD